MSEAPVEGGRPLLKGKIFGFPVHLDLSFVIIMGVLGWQPGRPAIWLVLWLLITPLAVLVHELGHAFVARTTGAEPQIALAGFGGVTSYLPPRPLSRARSLAISLAGPGVGLAIGGVLVVVGRAYYDQLDPLGWPALALEIGIWTCIGWSVLNLLPILPLDGGQAMRELLPGDHAVREHRAAGVSIVVAGLAAVVAYTYFGSIFLAFFLVFFGVSNIFAFRQTTSAGAGPARVSPQQQVLDLVWSNRPEDARRALEALPPEAHTDLALHGAVLALSGEKQQGHALLEQERQRRPGDHDVAALITLTYGLEHDWDRLVAYLQSADGPNTPPPVIDRVIEEARGTGREDVAGRLTLITRSTPPR